MANRKQKAGLFVPVINRNKCEGKNPCVEVCPEGVLEMYVLPAKERNALTPIGKIKGFAHGWKQAAVRYPERCIACGKCVSACPEHAITLARATTIPVIA